MAQYYFPRPRIGGNTRPKPEPPQRDVIDKIVDGGKRLIGGFLPPAINNRIGGGGSGGYRPPISSSATRPRQPSTPSYQAPMPRMNHSFYGGGKTFTRNQNGSITVSRPDGTSNTWEVGSANHNFARKTLREAGGNWDSLKNQYNDDDNNPVTSQARPPITSLTTRPAFDQTAYLTRKAGEFNDANRKSHGLSVRPDPYLPQGAGYKEFTQLMTNLASENAERIYDREMMGSAEEAQILANNQRYEADKVRYERDKERVQQMSERQANEAWLNYLREQSSLGEMLALQGINGGATESAYLSQGNAYENSLQGIRQNTSNQLADIDTQLRQHEFEKEAQNAEIRARQEMRREEIAQQERDRALRWALEAANMAMGQERWQREFDLGLENRDYQRGIDSRDWDFKMRGYDDSRSDASWERAMAEKKFGLEQGRYDMDKKMFGLEYGLAKKKLDNYGIKKGKGSGSVGTGSLSLADTASRYIPAPLKNAPQSFRSAQQAAIAENAKRRALQVEQDYKAGRISTQEYISEKEYLDQVARNFGY